MRKETIMEKENIREAMEKMMEWARECGELQLGYFRSAKLHERTKLNESDIVTEADGKSESIILKHIAEDYPEHSVLGEETGAHQGDAEWRWVIDPLDGTTNFKAGLPIFTVSIALEHNGEAVAGVVYAPYLDEMFTAIKGEGAYLNGKKIKTGGTDELARAVVCTGFPVDKGENPDNNLDNFARVMPKVRAVRRLGSAALDTCYVGAGFLDAYWELHLHQWDFAAAMLIAAEGGAHTEMLRRESELDTSIFVSGPKLAGKLRPLLK